MAAPRIERNAPDEWKSGERVSVRAVVIHHGAFAFHTHLMSQIGDYFIGCDFIHGRPSGELAKCFVFSRVKSWLWDRVEKG